MTDTRRPGSNPPPSAPCPAPPRNPPPAPGLDRAWETPRRQRAVELLLSMGYRWHDGKWDKPLKSALSAEELDGLSERVRNYVMWLETSSGQGGVVQDNFRLTEENAGLRAMIAERPAAQEEVLGVIEQLADDVDSCVSDACGYLASDRGWDDYGIYRDDHAARYRALPDRIRALAAPVDSVVKSKEN